MSTPFPLSPAVRKIYFASVCGEENAPRRSSRPTFGCLYPHSCPQRAICGASPDVGKFNDKNQIVRLKNQKN